MNRHNYVFTPARAAALARAREVRSRKAGGRSRGVVPTSESRGTGSKGLRRNFVPYVRVNKRSQTVGYNAGTLIPGTGKRLVMGSYIRLESRSRKTATDRAIAKVTHSLAPKGTKRGAARAYAAKNITVTNPALRANVGGSQIRLGSSRGSGPTVILRRGSHRASQKSAFNGIKKFDSKMRQKPKAAGRKSRRKKAKRK
jgi:hypothetical protein